MGDIYNNLLAKVSLPNAARTASANGAGVDRAGFRSVLCVVFAGTITDGTHTIEIQESDVVGSGYTAVADANLQGAEPAIVAADDDKVFEVGYTGSKQFVRVIVTAAGTTTGGVYGAVVVLGNPRVSPVVRS